MWLFTRIGFFSIVKKENGEVHIRGRCREHLEALQRKLGAEYPVAESFEGSDYPFRIITNAARLGHIMIVLGNEVTYPNFKGCLARDEGELGRAYSYLAHDVWRAGVGFQRDAEVIGRAAAARKKSSNEPNNEPT